MKKTFAIAGLLLASAVFGVERPWIVGHRGGKAEYEDNAIGAFVQSLKYGITSFETDVRVTKDGHLVIMHDADVSRTTDGKGNVAEMTLAEFKALKMKISREAPPSVADLVEIFAGRSPLRIEFEMKDWRPLSMEEYCDKLYRLASEKMVKGTYIFTSFNKNLVKTMRKVRPDAETALITGRTLDDKAIEDAIAIGASGIAPMLKSGGRKGKDGKVRPLVRTTKEMVAKAHAKGLKISVWPVPNAATYKEAHEVNADTCTSDYPVTVLRATSKADDMPPKCRLADKCADGRPAVRWRGFNLHEMFIKGKNGKPREFLEDDFRMISGWGFNFVRLPMDYRFWIVDGDWDRIDENVVAYIDRAIALGRKWKVHVQVCMHRCPGYIVANPRDERDLFTDPEAQRVCAKHWAYFAKRWKGIPNESLSFNLFNEPPLISEEKYGAVVKLLVDSIRREDPERFIILDGIHGGRLPLKAAYGLRGVGQSTRGYKPTSVSHYLAPWYGKPSLKPLWPLSADAPAGLLAKSTKKELCGKPLEVWGLPPCRVTANWHKVSGSVTVRFSADGKILAEQQFEPKPGAPNWQDVNYYPQWKIYQGIFTGKTEINLPAGAKILTVELVKGDWIGLVSLTVTSPEGKTAVLNVCNVWEPSTNFKQIFAGFDAKTPFAPPDVKLRKRRYADMGREYLYRTMIKQWEEAISNGTFVMAGEFAVWRKTPHDITLNFLEDYLSLWKERDMSWAMWDFRGGMGVLDSQREDVEYEDFEGHKLDRKMLDLLRRY